MDIQSGNTFKGNVVEDSFMCGNCCDRPHKYPRLENEQVLNLPPMPHKRFNKIYDRTRYHNDGQFGDGSDWITFPTMVLTKFGWVCNFNGWPTYVNCGNDKSLDILDITDAAIAVEFGMLTSVEYGDESADKLNVAVSDYNKWNPNFVINIGDLLERPGGNHDQSLTDLDVIEAVYDNLTMSRYYTFGNHDLDYISKSEFMAHTGMSEKYYSFDVGNYHFVVLDQCYRSDNDSDDYDSGNFVSGVAYIPPDERSWLENDLSNTTKKTFVFVEYHLEGICKIANPATIRTILENSGKVLAVIGGHRGTNSHVVINGISYYGLRSMDEEASATYSKFRIYADDSYWLKGSGGQINHNYTYSPIKIEAWVKQPILAHSKAIVAKGDEDSTVTYMFYTNNGKLRFLSSENPTPILSADTFQGDIWNHLALIIDGTSLRFYINGQEDSNNPLTINVLLDGHNKNVSVGRGTTGGGYAKYFNGTIGKLLISKGTNLKGD